MTFNKKSLEYIKIFSICKNEYKYFFNKKNVIGVALGYKITKGFCTFKKCISIFVNKKLSYHKLSNNDVIPAFYKGFLTDIIESDIPKCQSLTTRIRPVINGYSIGNLLRPNFGTCGCLVKDKYLYILSCNHILALNNTAPLESPILQPGVGDGGTIKKDVIGHLSRFIPIKFINGSPKAPENEVDCALCKVINRSFVSPKIAFVGIPKGTFNVKLHDNVKKVGRTTELTMGKITNLHGTFLIQCQSVGKEALFKDLIFTTKMTTSGDSGSILLNNDNYAIGLCIGGVYQFTIANPIETVLNSLKVELVTE